jgi:hypothetical protein
LLVFFGGGRTKNITDGSGYGYLQFKKKRSKYVGVKSKPLTSNKRASSYHGQKTGNRRRHKQVGGAISLHEMKCIVRVLWICLDIRYGYTLLDIRYAVRVLWICCCVRIVYDVRSPKCINAPHIQLIIPEARKVPIETGIFDQCHSRQLPPTFTLSLLYPFDNSVPHNFGCPVTLRILSTSRVNPINFVCCTMLCVLSYPVPPSYVSPPSPPISAVNFPHASQT